MKIKLAYFLKKFKDFSQFLEIMMKNIRKQKDKMKISEEDSKSLGMSTEDSLNTKAESPPCPKRSSASTTPSASKSKSPQATRRGSRHSTMRTRDCAGARASWSSSTPRSGRARSQPTSHASGSPTRIGKASRPG